MSYEQMNPDPLITFYCDGRVTVSDKLKPGETAKLVLDQVKAQWMDDAQATKIRELIDRIKRLEEAGDAVAAIIGPPGSALWADENEVDAAWNNWLKAKEAKP